MKALSWLLLFCLIAGFGGCKTAEDRENTLSPGIEGAKASFRVLAISNAIHQFLLPYDAGFFPNHTPVQMIDSSLSDGDGILYRFNLGHGIVCRDGITRKGTFTIEVSDTVKNYKTQGKWQATVLDSFATLTSAGWEYCHGYMRIRAINADSAQVFANIFIAGKNQNMNVKIDSTSNAIMNYYLGGDFNHFKTGIRFNGTLSFITPGRVSIFSFTALDKKPDCSSCWNTGTAIVTDETQNKWEVGMNPFGNESCDQVFKVSKKIKKQWMEEVFNAW